MSQLTGQMVQRLEAAKLRLGEIEPEVDLLDVLLNRLAEASQATFRQLETCQLLRDGSASRLDVEAGRLHRALRFMQNDLEHHLLILTERRDALARAGLALGAHEHR